jgi:hypothetical protein
MFRKTPLATVVACLPWIASLAWAGELSEEEEAAGFVSMFNGRDFTGWRFIGEKPPDEVTNWKVVDGVIQLSGGASPHLATEREYADFEMRFEWRAMQADYNGGLFIRSRKDLGSNQLNLAKGSEGAFIGGEIEGAKTVGDLQKPAGEWNEWRVIVKNDTVTFFCNGKMAWDATGLRPEKGYIGLQAEGAGLEFRNLRILPARADDGDELDARRIYQIRRAIGRGVNYLKQQQNPDGSWSDIPGFPGGISALCTLALLKSGAALEDESVQKALDRLRSVDKRSKTYSTALATLVFCAAQPQRDRESIERNVRWLEKEQKRDGRFAGAWAYPESDGDNSNSGYAVLALYEAQRVGVNADQETWRRTLDYWVRSQNQDGSWGYKPGLPGTGSMTSSGIASVAAASEVLNENDLEGAAQRALARGLAWLGENFSVHNNRGTQGAHGWPFYYLNGIERVGRLTDKRLIGEHDWYREGAALLVSTQDKLSGFWTGTGVVEEQPQVGTGFALLFLSHQQKTEK